ncbi:MAG: hypothetical protein JXA90_16075, partial [Planctomycetes bacterium]|nr:hypothetical protein [Planctomycetota bacterium]
MQVGDVPSTAIRRGAPVLPWKPVRILLPHAADVHSVIVHPGPARRLEGAWFLPPGGEEFSPVGADPPPPPEPDPLIYGSDVPYPPGVHLEHGRQMKHGRSILCLSVCPVSYEPRSGRIDVLESLEVEVAIRRDASLPLAGRSGGTLLRPAHFADLASLVLNPPTEHEKRRAKDRGGGADDLVAYAVITTPELAPAFAPLVEARTAGGLPAAVFTTEWVYSQYSGLRPDGAQDDATRIRNFIADCYSSRGLEYVLLGGDADGGGGEPLVPTRYLQSRALFTQPIPADMYFGCLDGTFDGDGDGLYGEPDDGPDGDDVDFFCEVHVGRAPVDSLEEAESFVEKTIAYEESSDRVLREVLFVGEYLGFGGDYDWGGNLCDQIRSGSEDLFPSVGFLNSPFADFFRPRTLYDRDTLGGRWNRQALISILESGVHIVNHVGHADSSSVMRLSAAEIDSLAAGFPFLEYSQSCYAGAFDNQRPDGSYGGDSVAEHLLARRNGAAALVVNSRRGWASTGTADGPSHRFHRRFWHAVFQQGVLQWGAANDRSKEENLDAIQTSERSRFCAYELNTLGDPALTIHLAVSRGSLSFDRPFYSPGDFATVTLIDSDLDVSREEPDRASIEIRAETSGDTEVLELVETARASAVFRSSVEIATGVALADGRLQVTPPDTISARYEDDDRGDGQPALAEAQLPAVDPVQLTGACPKDASVGVPYRDQLLAGGGLLPYRFRSSAASYVEDLVESPSPPPGSGRGASVDRMPWFGDDRGWTYALPFEFPFYGRLHSSVVVSSNGYLDLGGGDGRLFANSVEGLIENKMIAPFWADLTVNEPGGIYIDEGFDWVSIQWVAQEYASEDPTSFWVTLSTDGRIVFGYGGANSGIEPTIGISAGNGQDYVISTISGRDDFSSAPRVYFIPTRLPGGLAVDAATGVISGVPEQVFSGEIALEVEDALGQRHRRVCHLEVRPDGLVLTAPQAGDLWLAGGRQTIRWEWFGNIGQNVQLDYNTDGSTTAFPQPIAASVSIAARSLTWDLPARGDVPLPARIRIQSVERPEFFTYSEVFQIVGPTLRILVPAGGEKWQVGTQVVIRWQSLGNVGSRVRIDYNIDGSRTAFPLTLAADVPNSVEALVTVPGTPSETCRLRVQSLASPSVLDVSAGTFAIRSPSLRILSPNGGECMRTSESTLITWASEGLTGNEVILEYNTDGSEDVFPNAVGGGPLPNTGSAQWQTPASPSPSCRLRIRSASQPSIFDVSDGTFSIEHRCAVRALVWVPYIPQDEEQVTGMTDAILRYRPDLEPVYSVQLTPEALRTDLANKDALVIPKQKRGSAIDFAALGLRLGPVLREFLGRGGAVVIGQQTTESEEFL